MFFLSAAFASPFARGRFVSLLSAPTAAFLAAAAVGLVNCGPGAPLCFLLPYAALFVTAFDLRGLAFLFSGIFLFASSCHLDSSSRLFLKWNASRRHAGFIVV